MSTESIRDIEKCAGEWLARRDAGDMAAHEQEAFDAWLSESTLHRVTYLRIENAWDQALRLKALGAGIQSDQPPAPGQWNLSPFFEPRAAAARPVARGPGLLRLRALAASLVLAVAVASAWYLWPSGNSYATRIGSVVSLPMVDGSNVILNTDSEIEVAMDEKERRIELKHGEAYFQVAKDPGRPFVVTVGDERIVAIGTKFSVRRDFDKSGVEFQVIVTEGVVRVESEKGESVDSMAPRRLNAGSVALASRGGLMVQTKKLPEVEEQLAWRSGGLVFRDVSLAEAVAEFNRYNERRIVIEDAAVAALTVGGNFRTTNVGAFVRLLEQGYPVRVDFQQDKIVLHAR